MLRVSTSQIRNPVLFIVLKKPNNLLFHSAVYLWGAPVNSLSALAVLGIYTHVP